MCEYNSSWQPIGMSAMKFKMMIGTIVKSRNYVRLRDEWKQVPQRTKEDICTTKKKMPFSDVATVHYNLPHH
jgi:hypothetical protein